MFVLLVMLVAPNGVLGLLNSVRTRIMGAVNGRPRVAAGATHEEAVHD